MCCIIATKTISIDEGAYNRLKQQKISNECFSDVVKRLTVPVEAKSLLEFSGGWNLNEKAFKQLKSRLKKLERNWMINLNSNFIIDFLNGRDAANSKLQVEYLKR